ncbi:hypothetical protein CGRA01v4_00534 [Colletotrichum graminicola]|nr:hypothetical protein CGRA01v4_00534 [Colletotrichum graminicola]
MKSPFFTATPPFWHRGLGYYSKPITTFCLCQPRFRGLCIVCYGRRRFILPRCLSSSSSSTALRLPVSLSLSPSLSPPHGILWLPSSSGETFPPPPLPSPPLPSLSLSPSGSYVVGF